MSELPASDETREPHGGKPPAPGPSSADRHAWLVVVVATAANAFGMPIEYLIERPVVGMPTWPAPTAAGVGFLLFAFMWLARRRSTVFLASTVFFINTIAIAVAFHITNAHFAALGAKWVPFQADKLAALVAAMLAPSLFSGFASIALYCVLPIVQYLGFSPEIRDQIALGEPWATMGFGLMACVVLIFRFARLALEARLAKAESEKQAMQKLTSRLLCIKDLMNTPLQILTVATTILREHGGQGPEILGHIDRAVESLTKINETLSKYEHEIHWEGQTLSFDAAKLLHPESSPRT